MFSWEDFIAGWLAGVASLIVGHPWDTVKVRQQVLHTTLLNATKKTFQYEGIRGFYKGLIFPMFMVGPSNAVFFGTYGNILRWQDSGKLTTRIKLDDRWMEKVVVAGIIAGIPQVIVTCPMELVKTKLQISTENQTKWNMYYAPQYKGIIDCIIKITQEDGIKGLYRGMTPLIIRDVPTSGIYMLSYETLAHYKYPHNLIESTLLKQIIAGGVAGLMSWIFVIPFDVVKSRMQSDNANNPQYKGMWDCMVQSYRAGGFRVFTKGSLAVCARVFPTNAALFVMYEYAFKFLNNL